MSASFDFYKCRYVDDAVPQEAIAYHDVFLTDLTDNKIDAQPLRAHLGCLNGRPLCCRGTDFRYSQVQGSTGDFIGPDYLLAPSRTVELGHLVDIAIDAPPEPRGILIGDRVQIDGFNSV